MKLTYRDKVLLIVILLCIIWAIGIMLVIRPKVQAVGTAETELSTVQAEYEKVQQDLAAAETVKVQCNELLKEAQEYAANFYDVPKSFEAEDILITLLQNSSNPIDVSDMTINGPVAAALSPYVADVTEVDIPIIDAADIGRNPEQATTGNTSSTTTNAESVGCYNYTITFKASPDNLLSFIDKIPTSNNKTSLVVTSLSIDDYGASEYEGTMGFSLYFVKELEGENVDEVLESNEEADMDAVDAAEEE